MATKPTKSSTPTRFTLAGRVKAPPRIKQEGSVTVMN
jgi:hypothetical protein